jgi:hypothetical protein
MRRSYRDWLVTIPFLVPVALSLFALLAIAGWSAVNYLMAPPLPDEHQRLLADLKGGAFSRLDDITPKPAHIYNARELHKPDPRGAHFLIYCLPESRELVVILDADLRLIDYEVRDQD